MKKYLATIIVLFSIALCWTVLTNFTLRILEGFRKNGVYNLPRVYGIYLDIFQSSIFALAITKLVKYKFQRINRIKRGLICSFLLLLSSGNAASIFLILLLAGYEPKLGLFIQFIMKWLFVLILAQVIVFIDDKYLTN